MDDDDCDHDDDYDNKFESKRRKRYQMMFNGKHDRLVFSPFFYFTKIGSFVFYSFLSSSNI